MTIKTTINGEERAFDLDPETPLLWALRDEAGLKGTKFGCGVGVCGSCTVALEGMAVRSCSVPVSAVDGLKIETIEGLSKYGLSAVQKAWIAEQVPQCGYCQPGMIMAATILLRDKPEPTDADIDDQITNVCRCGTYSRIRRAIHRAAKDLRA